MRFLFFANSDWNLYNFRLPLIDAVHAQGHDVTLVSPPGPYSHRFEEAGLRWIPFPLDRSGTNPLSEAATLSRLIRLYRREFPDVVHHFTFKCVLHGSVAARFLGIKRVVNSITGSGHMFADQSFWTRTLRPFVKAISRMALLHTQVIFQNPEDCNTFVKQGLASRESSYVIRSSGVNVERFSPVPEPRGKPVVVLASRMLWEKGIAEFVEAARRLGEQGVQGRFVLVGDPDPQNLKTVPRNVLEDWKRSGVVEWWGHQDNMPEVFASSNLVCFPSYYGEGVPKVLIEAAACGRAIVTTDVPGCREVVRNGENGLLVPARDPNALADALKALILNPELRAMMGVRGREIAVKEFSEELVIQRTMEVYRSMLAPHPLTAAGKAPSGI
jgi:glycosyltransferase involved in cell wall biosynthesis